MLLSRHPGTVEPSPRKGGVAMSQLTRRGLGTVLVGGALASGTAIGAVVAGSDTVRPDRVLSRGRGRWTGFGSVNVGAARRATLAASAVGAQHQDHNIHVPKSHRTWSDTVRVDVEVHNGTERPILVSPGQFRLRVGSTGPTVTPYQSGWPVGPLSSSTTLSSWITYLAPPGAVDMWVEYVEPGATAPQAFVISPEVAL